MTQEEKAKRYDVVVKKAESLYKAAEPMSGCNVIIETLFPELAESEDEQHRKWVLEYLYDGLRKSDEQFKGQFKCAIAWLEKQGEQKPANKVEPKFHKGEWITHNTANFVFKIINFGTNGYEVINRENFKKTISFDNEENYHLWTIQDAKDGDVLHAIGWHSDCIFIFSGLDNWKFDEPDGEKALATGYCCIHVYSDMIEFGTQGPDCIEVNTVKPATEIQRNLLLRQMRVNGYEWNADKKELKKIEQKPYTETLDKDIELYYYTYGNGKGGFDNLSLEKFKDIVKTFVDDYGMQKPFWSEEDEKIFRALSSALARISSNTRTDSTSINYSFFAEIDWLKSLKDRVQPKQEWSEEDKKKYCNTIELLEDMKVLKEKYDLHPLWVEQCDEAISWLKSLRPQNRWKPSDEQMDALKGVQEGVFRLGILESLYNDLMKLKG